MYAQFSYKFLLPLYPPQYCFSRIFFIYTLKFYLYPSHTPKDLFSKLSEIDAQIFSSVFLEYFLFVLLYPLSPGGQILHPKIFFTPKAQISSFPIAILHNIIIIFTCGIKSTLSRSQFLPWVATGDCIDIVAVWAVERRRERL